MDLYDAMSTQRAVRRLRPDAIPEPVLAKVLAAAAWAPTGGNVQPFRMITVTDRQKLSVIQKLYQTQWSIYTESMRAEGDGLALPRQKMLRAGDYLAANMHEVPVLVVVCFNANLMAITDADLDRPSIVGGGSVYTAVQNLMLACRAEGLGCVLTTLLCYQEQEIKALLEIPEEWGTCAAIPIGYPVLKGYGPISRRPIDKLVFDNVWGQSASLGETHG
ncbi:MAG: nitroreductase family protein [Proteobacteria bacterium]|nr:nitroreductase family protein [Pseudomonadota bacterium]MDA0957097.1 nitroreductase family protein [Pseudomonadota bacterium]MDA1207324.1 nitroreductase family protein [Pseudomonadota bacterium]